MINFAAKALQHPHLFSLDHGVAPIVDMQGLIREMEMLPDGAGGEVQGAGDLLVVDMRVVLPVALGQ